MGFEFLQNQRVEVRLPTVERPVLVRVLDSFPDVLLLRVTPELAEASPDEVELGFGQRGTYYHADVSVEAFYSHAWFVSHPDPETARKSQRRKFVRIRHRTSVIAMEVNVYGEPTGASFALELENLSAGGCLATVDRPGVGDYMMVLLTMLESDSSPILARVMNRRQLPDGRLALGISFDSLTLGMQDTLAEHINREIQRHLNAGHDLTV